MRQTMQADVRFVVPPELAATAPPEERGLARDQVRLLVTAGDEVRHASFADLALFLSPGDVLVLNTSATLPAAVDARREDGRRTTVHFSTPLDNGEWVVELRGGDGTPERVHDVRRGELIHVPEGELVVIAAYPNPAIDVGSRLWSARLALSGDVPAYLARHGRPITYGYVNGRWPLEAYQTVFATEPGSAEMPSAGRPFTAELLVRLIARGVVVVPLVLHAGVSSLDKGETPLPERFRVPHVTAEQVTLARLRGSRVVAVGTTAVRALESVATPDARVHAGGGWTDLVLRPERPARVVDSVITGFHDPAASHLLLLDAIAGRKVVDRANEAALAHGYLWHEFGDSCLLLRP